MADVTIHGFPQSTYVRTARLTCEEKGVAYDLDANFEFGSDAHAALHPFQKMPAFSYGDVRLYETGAIARYVDRAFDGPALQPSDAAGLARMDQWVSATSDYVYQVMVREVIVPRVLHPRQGIAVDEDAVAAGVAKADGQLGTMATALGAGGYFAGDQVSLADFFVLPILFYLSNLPDGKAILPKHPAVGDWLGRMSERPSFAATMPPMPDSEAAE